MPEPSRTYPMHIDDLSKVMGVSRSYVEKRIAYDPNSDEPWVLDPLDLRRFLQKKGTSYDPRVVSFINLRGGIGKTTGAISLATRASQYGFNTCLLDLDSQASATMALDRVPEDDEPVFYDVWQHPEEMVLGSIRPVNDRLHILPSSLENGLLDAAMVNPKAQKNGVAGIVDVLIENETDLIVIDGPPSLGAAVISSICASDRIVIPVGNDPFSIKGLEITLQEIESICDTFQVELPEISVLYSRYDRREKMTKTTLDYLKKNYPDKLVKKPIRTSTEFSKALAERRSVFGVQRNSTARKDYDEFTRNLLQIKF